MNFENRVNPNVRDMPPSGIRKFFDIAAGMRGVISLSVGEPDFVTPWNIREAAIYSIEQGHTHYTSNSGIPELREMIGEYLAGRFNLRYDPGDIVVTVGASEGIDIALRAIVQPGDEVLVPDPSYVSYMPCVTMAGGVPVALNCVEENNFIITPEVFLAGVTPKTKAIILPYPNNPTGAIMNEEQMKALAQAIAATDILVISDEIYAELTYEGTHISIASLPGMMERTILLNGFSKAFAMTGWRLGYCAGSSDLIALMLKIHQYTIMCAPTATQYAALEALRHGMENEFDQVAAMRREYNRRRRYVVSAFNNMGLHCFEPLGAFYAFPNISAAGLDAETFCERLLKEQYVAMVPGTAFGRCNDFIRCSYAASMENIREAMKRVEAFVRSVQADG